MKTALVCGAGGFIGSHLVKRLRVRFLSHDVDLKFLNFQKLTRMTSPSAARDEFVSAVVDRRRGLPAANMGGAGYAFTSNSADIMHNSATINLNVSTPAACVQNVFTSSSACSSWAQPARSGQPQLLQDSAYPTNPDSEYGRRSCSLRALPRLQPQPRHELRVTEYVIFWAQGACRGQGEAPAALCRKVAGEK